MVLKVIPTMAFLISGIVVVLTFWLFILELYLYRYSYHPWCECRAVRIELKTSHKKYYLWALVGLGYLTTL